jgi:putative transposase
LLGAYAYVECNPIRAALVETAAAYAWSSAAHHLGLRSDPMITDHAAYWALGNTPFERQASYRSILEGGNTQQELERIRAAMNKGWLLTHEKAEPEWAVGANRRAISKPRGRPPKSESDK